MSALPRAKILVVDDEAHGRLALQELLEGPDREIVAAASGEAALREVATADFALILLDVRMAGMDGFETARLIHRCERAQRTPIIFLTGAYEDMASVMRGYAAGAVDYVAWTDQVAGFAGRPDLQGAPGSVWITGRVSPEAQRQFAARGWTVHQNVLPPWQR